MSSCPVGYTCPTIDDVISCLESSSLDILENIDWLKVDPESYLTYADRINDAVGDIRSMYGNRSTHMEEIREANASLREWGYSLEEEKNELSMEVNGLRETVEEMEKQIDSLLERIQDLEKEIEDAE